MICAGNYRLWVGFIWQNVDVYIWVSHPRLPMWGMERNRTDESHPWRTYFFTFMLRWNDSYPEGSCLASKGGWGNNHDVMAAFCTPKIRWGGRGSLCLQCVSVCLLVHVYLLYCANIEFLKKALCCLHSGAGATKHLCGVPLSWKYQWDIYHLPTRRWTILK